MMPVCQFVQPSRLLVPPYMAQPVSIRDKLEKYTAVRTHFGKADKEECSRCIEVLKHYQRAQCIRLIQQSGDLPILVSYSSDGTPVEVATRRTVSIGPHHKQQRHGSDCHEFLVQRQFVRYTDSGGAQQTRVMLSGPVPLMRGKSA